MKRTRWSIRCFQDSSGDIIDDWYRQQPEELQAKFDTQLRYLREQPPANWCPPYFKALQRECKGLGEVRFEFHNVQYRPLGFFAGQLEFILVLVATKKGSVFDPRNACELGQRRKSLILADKQRHSRDCEF
jgi:hypothetical protein